MAPEWLVQAIRDMFQPRVGKRMRKISRIAARIDARDDDMASAIKAISENLRA